MISDFLSVGAVVIGGGFVVGATIAVIGKEVALNADDSVLDKAETSLIRIGYVSEGVLKGAMISVPVSLIALLGVNYALKTQKKIVGEF